MSKAIILMGVSGSGRITIGKHLSRHTGLPFFEGDSFHPRDNVEKMSSGIPLDDEDRRPWLDTLHKLIKNHLKRGHSLILASSALKKKHRAILRGDPGKKVFFVYLKGDYATIRQRMTERQGHYMNADMLHSQFATLEEPISGEALVININQPIPTIVEKITGELHLTEV